MTIERLFIVLALLFIGSVVGLLYYVDKNAVIYTDNLNTVCLDDISYWYRKSGYTAVLAVKIDPNTLTYVKCSN